MAGLRGVSYEELERTVEAQRRAGARVVSDEPRQASLRRLRRFEVRPNRELGQNFLIDDNILGVIGRAAELVPDDVVLEVGGGLGVLSEYLAPQVRHLHVVEVDRSLEAPLAEALAPFANATLHLADAVKLDLASLDPAPNKVVANLPYGVAATVLLKSIAELPGATLWVAMVQREVGDRLAAAPGRQVLRRHVRPRAARLRGPLPAPGAAHGLPPRAERGVGARPDAPPRRPPRRAELTALVHAGFAHRRKALAGSLALTPGARPELRDATRAALERLGRPADARAERLAPEEWPRLAEAIGPERLAELRPRA